MAVVSALPGYEQLFIGTWGLVQRCCLTVDISTCLAASVLCVLHRSF